MSFSPEFFLVRLPAAVLQVGRASAGCRSSWHGSFCTAARCWCTSAASKPERSITTAVASLAPERGGSLSPAARLALGQALPTVLLGEVVIYPSHTHTRAHACAECRCLHLPADSLSSNLNKVFLFLSKGLPQIAKPVLAGTRPLGGNALPSGGVGPDPGPAGRPGRRLPVLYSGGADKHSSVLLHCYHILRVPQK